LKLLTDKGQTLLEVIIAITVGIIVIGALTFATISSLRNADFAQKQSQATKLAQEGIEKVRGIRDRDEMIDNGSQVPFSSIYSTTCNPTCTFYFKMLGPNTFSLTQSSVTEDLGDGFTRQIVVSDISGQPNEKKVISLVKWSDYSGEHESRLTTILGKL
jgi:hypothetical protein